MLDIVSIGGATRDFFFEIDQLSPAFDASKNKILPIPYGEKLVADSAFYGFGGGAVNTAISFSRLGLRAAPICKIGQDGSGRLIKRQLKKEGASTRFVKEDVTFHTGLTVFVLGKDAEHTGFLERGANNHLIVDRMRPLKKARWFYISSLTGQSAKLLPKFFAFAKRHKIKIAFNPGSTQLNQGYNYLKDFLPEVEILILNREEAESLVRSRKKTTPKNVEELLVEIEKMGPKIVVITLDGAGSSAISDGKIYHQKAYADGVVDTTGAGDAFGSTFTYGVMKNFDLRHSLKIAAINAGSVVGKMGATDGLLSYNRIKRSKWL